MPFPNSLWELLSQNKLYHSHGLILLFYKYPHVGAIHRLHPLETDFDKGVNIRTLFVRGAREHLKEGGEMRQEGKEAI